MLLELDGFGFINWCSRIRSVLERSGLDQIWESQNIGDTNKFMLLFKESIVGIFTQQWGGGPRVVVSTAASHARVRGSVPGLGGLKETKTVSSHPRVKVGSCWEPPWPRGSVLGLRPPGLEFRVLCLEDSVISTISPPSWGSPGPV